MFHALKAIVQQRTLCHSAFLSEDIVCIRRVMAEIAQKERVVFVVGCWVGYGDLCLEMAFWNSLKQKYPNRPFYYLIPLDKEWVLKSFEPSERLRIIPISYKQKRTLENPFLFKMLKRELGKSVTLIYGKIACRGYMLMSGNFHIGLPLLRCYKHNLGIERTTIPTPMPYDSPIGVKRERIALFNTESKSLFIHDRTIFLQLVESCLKKGYKIIFNQAPIASIEGEVFTGSVQELRSLYARCSLLVSVRSGIMDLAVGTGINMLAIYPAKPRNALRAYTLKQWQSSSERIIEVNERDVAKKAEQLIQSFEE